MRIWIVQIWNRAIPKNINEGSLHAQNLKLRESKKNKICGAVDDKMRACIQIEILKRKREKH